MKTIKKIEFYNRGNDLYEKVRTCHCSSPGLGLSLTFYPSIDERYYIICNNCGGRIYYIKE